MLQWVENIVMHSCWPTLFILLCPDSRYCLDETRGSFPVLADLRTLCHPGIRNYCQESLGERGSRNPMQNLLAYYRIKIMFKLILFINMLNIISHEMLIKLFSI